jgi:hypothetical protein
VDAGAGAGAGVGTGACDDSLAWSISRSNCAISACSTMVKGAQGVDGGDSEKVDAVRYGVGV